MAPKHECPSNSTATSKLFRILTTVAVAVITISGVVVRADHVCNSVRPCGGSESAREIASDKYDIISSGLRHHRRESKPSIKPTLVLYFFEQYYDVPGTNTTNILSVSPSGSLMALKWGDLGLSEQPIRASSDPSAPIIGIAPAFFYPNKKPRTYSLLKTVELDTPQYKGTFLITGELASLIDFETEEEFGITGGTGSFRDASGYMIASLVDKAPDHKTYKYQIFLSTCVRFPLHFS